MLLDETLAFVSVVEAGSFTGASRKLRVPKSTLSRRVSRLESHLNARLLHRTTRRLSLTETGEAYFARCREAIADIEAAERAALDVAGNPSGTLRVSTPFDLARDHLAPLVPEFNERFPEVQLRFVMTQRRIDMIAEGFDVALRGGVLEDSGFISRKLSDSEILLCASPAYLDRRGRPRTIEELAEHDGVLMEPEGKPDFRFPMPTEDGVVPIVLQPRITANEWGFLRTLLLAGLGIGPMLSWSVREDIEAGRLEHVLPDSVLREGGLHAVYPSRSHLTPKVRVFVDFLAEKLGGGL
jgi:DNA-binding transcriptional LysR family regulator